MHFLPKTCFFLLSGCAQTALANWSVDFFTKGCPKDGNPADPGVELVGSIGGQPGQEIWCYRVDSAHAGFTDGIEADGMKIDLFADWQCQSFIETWDTDGCLVVNSDEHTVIAGARIVPK